MNESFSLRHRQGGGTLLGLFMGLVVGVLIAFGVVWYLNKSPFLFVEKGARSERADANSAEPAQPVQPLPLPGKPGDQVDDKPRFDFYKILPGRQEATPTQPEQAAPAAQLPSAVAPPAAPAAAGGSFYLQAGAFQNSGEADNLKAKLAMMGLETDVQVVTLAGQGKVHRVRVGPYSKPEELNRVRAQLSQNGIQATVVKANGP
ncbi:cell division protein FtsN [mine drainage metagenome]|uniref:Cell division protein FtsN n=1 Tax=mine drainage metagenome TaxID=410659 RepID=A0A1J5QW08_9ZZZZ